MTIYDYRCNDCSEVFDEKHPMDFKGVVICPICLSGDTHKLVVMPAVKLDWKDTRTRLRNPADQLARRYRGSIGKEKRYENKQVHAIA